MIHKMDWKFIYEKIENKTHTTKALIAGIILLLGIFLGIDPFLSKYISLIYLRWIYVGLSVLWFVYWFLNRFYILKNRKNRVGVVLCIYADSDEAERNLKRDFVDTLKKQILDEQLGQIFQVITIKNHITKKFNNFESIKKLHLKVKGHIYIFGETKKRKNGADQYFLSLDGSVMHRPVDQNTSQELSKDFLATLPKGINFNDEFAFEGFQVSADIVLRSVKYIVGLAAFVSGDFNLAIKLHNNFKQQMKQSTVKLPSHDNILNKLNLIMANEHALLAHYHFLKGQREEANKNLEEALKCSDKCYRAFVLQTIIAFSWEQDPKKALTISKKCHNFNFPEWRYNEAFLHFWLGSYPSALKQCDKIKKQNYPNEIATSQEVTQFNESLLSSEIDKPALYFWLGYNYYFKQNNLPLALNNFELFEQKSDNTMTILKQKSSGWLIEIKKQMDLFS